jgi:hypothetical protein
MSLHHMTSQLTPQQATAIPATKFIYQQETFLIKPPKFMPGESYPRAGKELVPHGFSYNHHNPDFTLVAAPSLAMNYGTYIYNIVDGFQ